MSDYVPDETVMKVLKNHLDSLDQEKDIIVEGYPKTLYQSMALLKSGIIPDLFIVMNFSNERAKEYSKRKFSPNEYDSDPVSNSDRSVRGEDYLNLYNL